MIPAADVRKSAVYRQLERTVREVLGIPEGPLTDRTLRAAVAVQTDRAHREGYEQAGLDLEALHARLAEMHDRLQRARAVLDHVERPPEASASVGLYDTPLDALELSIRADAALRRIGITTLGQVVRCTERELLSSPNVGRKTLNEVKEMLYEKGLRLRRR